MRQFVSFVALTVAIAPVTASAETMAEALAKAYANNPTLEGQRAATRQSDEGFAQARAGLLPQVSVSGTYGRREVETESTFAGLTTRTRSTTEPNSYGLQASQTLYAGGRRLAQMAQADAQIEVSQQTLRITEQQVLFAAVSAYMNVRRDEEALKIRMANVQLLEEQLRAAQERFQVGVLTRTDVAQAEARLAGAMAGVAGARADLEASKATYEQVIGSRPDGLAPPPPVTGLPANLDEAIAVALDASPVMLRARSAEKAAREAVKIETADLLPSVSVVGRVDRTFDQAGAGIDQDISSATAQLNIPLFEGGFARSRTRSAKIGVDRAQAGVEEARRAVVAQVVEAWNDYQATLRVIEASKKQVAANTLALEGVTLEADIGERTTLDVLNARQELLESQLQLIRAERDSFVAANGLLAAVGRLDARGLNLAVDPYDPEQHRKAVRWRVFSTDPAAPR
jgi:outer membrane protein